MDRELATRVLDHASTAFSDRLLKRWALWWGRPFCWSSADSYRDACHRLHERFALRSRSEPDIVWRCCSYWPRTLVNKWNSREFVQKHGCRVPELYWHGRQIGKIPFASLPTRYVMRPVWGAAQSGVHVVADGKELLRRIPAEAIPSRVLREHGPVALTPLLIEEFVPPGDGSAGFPIEYKCHTFGSQVAAIQVTERTAYHVGSHRFYTPGWESCPDVMDRHYPLGPPSAPPRCLDQMLEAASRLGAAIGTYMRIDFFASDAGAVFNEFSSTPQIRRPEYTHCCEETFGALWQQQFPDAV